MPANIVIAGAGPAGMVAAVLLLRRGHRVTVVEKNPDFAREFRGEVLMPRFMDAMASAGLLDVIQSIPAEHFSTLKLIAQGRTRTQIDLGSFHSQFGYATWMTQPDLLEGLCREAEKHDGFTMKFGSKVTSLLRSREPDGKVTGVIVESKAGQEELNSDVVIGADGRFSQLRKLGGFDLSFSSHRFDVLWFHTQRPDDFDRGVDFFVHPSFLCLTLPKYPDLIQCGILLGVDEGRRYLRQGFKKIGADLVKTHPMFEAFAQNLTQQSPFTILQAKIERVSRWAQDGLVLIGDAAHTCSPIFAIGVTIAVESAIVAAEVIDQAPDYSQKSLSEIEKRRLAPVLRIQNLQDRVARGGVLNPPMRRLLPWVAPIGVRLGLANRVLQPVLGSAAL